MNTNRGLISFINFGIVVLVLVTCIGCKAQVSESVKTQTKTVVPEETTESSKLEKSMALNQLKDGKKDGLWRAYHKNNQLKSEGSYTADLKEGLHREWDKNGILVLEGYYENGKANGLMKWFHEGGHLAGEGQMKDDIRFGKWKICDIQESGFCIEAHFIDGKRDGIWKINHADARDKLWKEQTFKDDKMVSEKCWDQNGKVIECK